MTIPGMTVLVVGATGSIGRLDVDDALRPVVGVGTRFSKGKVGSRP